MKLSLFHGEVRATEALPSKLLHLCVDARLPLPCILSVLPRLEGLEVDIYDLDVPEEQQQLVAAIIHATCLTKLRWRGDLHFAPALAQPSLVAASAQLKQLRSLWIAWCAAPVVDEFAQLTALPILTASGVSCVRGCVTRQQWRLHAI